MLVMSTSPPMRIAMLIPKRVNCTATNHTTRAVLNDVITILCDDERMTVRSPLKCRTARVALRHPLMSVTTITPQTKQHSAVKYAPWWSK